MTRKLKSSNGANLSSRSKGRKPVSFELEPEFKRQIDELVRAGRFDSFSAYMRRLVRKDLGVSDDDELPEKKPGRQN